MYFFQKRKKQQPDLTLTEQEDFFSFVIRKKILCCMVIKEHYIAFLFVTNHVALPFVLLLLLQPQLSSSSATSSQQLFCNLLLAVQVCMPPFIICFTIAGFFFYFRMYVRHDSKLQTYLKVYEIGCIVCCRQIPYDLYVDHHQGLKLDAMFVVDRFHLIILLTVVSIAKPQLVCQLCL